MIVRTCGALALALAMGAAAPAFANNIPLFNTGVDDSGNVLANGSIDTHYSIVNVGAPRSATSANGYPIGPWIGDDSLSSWVGPNTDSALDGDIADYDYRVTFSLAGLNAATAAISGQWSTDNSGVDILINGHSTGMTANDFTNWYSFNISSGFVSGVNTLDFIVHNAGGPTGLRVEMTGTAAVPEPASWALMLGGFGLVGGAMRRRKAAVHFA